MNFEEKIKKLEKENEFLKNELRKRGYIFIEENISLNTQQKMEIYLDYFKGRQDIYAKKYYSNKTNTTGWTPACLNEFKEGYCLKGKIKKACDTCRNEKYQGITNDELFKHFTGKSKNMNIGIYPLLKDNTCNFLCIDFDDENWFEEMLSVYKKALSFDILPLMERSSSGMGGHLWFFFSQPVKARKARELGILLLQETMETNGILSFKSFDRMFPNQDILPEKGFGNLIALPLEYYSLRKGNSTFINDLQQEIKQPIEYLKSIPKINEIKIDEILSKKIKNDYFFENNQMVFDFNIPAAYSKEIDIVENTMLCIKKENLNAYTINLLKRFASMYNPEYYLKQSLRQAIYLETTPRVLEMYEEDKEYLYLPRGLKNKIYNILNEAKINLKSNISNGHEINVSFKGELRRNQIEPVSKMLEHEMGVLKAVPGFGKTVMGIYIISQLKINTLVIVPTKEIQNQWLERIDEFLEVPKAKLKKERFVCAYNGSKKRLNKNIDIATASSLANIEDLSLILNQYGLIIIDECHHAASTTFTKVLRNANAKYIYGLSASLKREDGLEKIIYMHCGPILYELSHHEIQLNYTFKQVLVPRATNFKLIDKELNYVEICNVIVNNQTRNHLIIKDVIEEFKEGNNIIILSERIEHLDILYEMLKNVNFNVYKLSGSIKEKERKDILDKVRSLKDNNYILLATSKLLGEGFDLPTLNRLFLVMPISAESRIIQYTGRIHRNHEDKEIVKVYDYIDINVSMLQSMFQKRLKQYQKEGYYLEDNAYQTVEVSNMVFNGSDYYETYLKDINNAQTEIVIMNKKIEINKLKKDFKVLQEKFNQNTKLHFILNKKIHNGEIIDNIEGLGGKVVDFDHGKHFIVIDKRIVWYSNFDFYGRQYQDSYSTRFVDEIFAEEILGLIE